MIIDDKNALIKKNDMQLILLINPPREDHFMLYGSTSNDEVLACVRKEPSLAAHCEDSVQVE